MLNNTAGQLRAEVCAGNLFSGLRLRAISRAGPPCTARLKSDADLRFRHKGIRQPVPARPSEAGIALLMAETRPSGFTAPDVLGKLFDVDPSSSTLTLDVFSQFASERP
jgi:hypothetical protein